MQDGRRAEKKLSESRNKERLNSQEANQSPALEVKQPGVVGLASPVTS